MKDIDSQIKIFKESFDTKDILNFEEQQEELWRLVNDILKGNIVEKRVERSQSPQRPPPPQRDIYSTGQKKQQQQQQQQHQHHDKDMTSATAITSLLMKQKVPPPLHQCLSSSRPSTGYLD
jgi:hypothetical protein